MPPPLLDPAQLAEHLPCVSLQTDLSGQITYLSPHWQQLTGYLTAECIGKPFQYYIDPDDHSKLKPLFLASVAEPDSEISLRCLCANHEVRWIQLCAHVVTVAGGGAGIVGMILDISQRIGREATLMANHRTVNGMLNDFQGMVYRCRNDPNWSMQYVSGGSLKLTGYRPRDIINNTRLSYGSLIIEGDRKRVWHIVQRALQEKSSFDIVYHIQTAGGGVKRVWERGKGIFSGSNDLLGLEGFITDISLYQGDLYPAMGSKAQSLLMNQTAGQIIPHSFFLDRLSERHVRYQHDGLPYAVFYLHLDNCRKHCEHLDLDQIRYCAAEVIRRITPLLKQDDSISYELLNEVRLLIDGFASEAELKTLNEALHEAFIGSISIGDWDLFLTLSIGLAQANPEQASGLVVLAEAEEAMVRAHEVGGNRTSGSSS